MKINFYDLGRIKKASLELGKLTVIVGDNSMGKTILLEAYTLYENVMKEYLSEFSKFDIFEQFDFKEISLEDMSDHSKLSRRDNSLIKKVEIEYKLRDKEEISELINKYEKKYVQLLKNNILYDPKSKAKVKIQFNEVSSNIFPKKFDVIINPSENEVIGVRVKINRRTYMLGRGLRLGDMKIQNEIEVLNDEVNYINNINTSIREMYFQRIKSIIVRSYFTEFLGLNNTIFFPSERQSYQISAKKKSARFLEESFVLNEKEDSMLENNNESVRYSESLFIKNYFQYQDILEFEEESLPYKSPFTQKLYRLLCNSLGGEPEYENGNMTKIKVNDKESIPKKLFSTKQNRFSPYMMLTTNMVLRSDSVFIEEPEAHMSLKGMFELQDIIKVLLERVNVLITSHSDVFVSLLNNIIIENKIDAKVYELIEKKDGNYLEEVRIGEFGAEINFMSEQLIRLNEQSVKIYNKLNNME